MILTVHLKPNARESRIVSWLDDNTLKAEVKEPPEKGRANKALVLLLAKELKLAQSQIEIVRGKTARIKQIKIST